MHAGHSHNVHPGDKPDGVDRLARHGLVVGEVIVV